MINGEMIANQSGLNKSKTNKWQKQNIAWIMLLESKFTDNIIPLHFLINALVHCHGRTSDTPWVFRTTQRMEVLVMALVVQCLADLLAQPFQALGVLMMQLGVRGEKVRRAWANGSVRKITMVSRQYWALSTFLLRFTYISLCHCDLVK